MDPRAYFIPDLDLARRASEEVPALRLVQEWVPGSVRVTARNDPLGGDAAVARTWDAWRVSGLEFASPEAALSWLWRVTMNRV